MQGFRSTDPGGSFLLVRLAGSRSKRSLFNPENVYTFLFPLSPRFGVRSVQYFCAKRVTDHDPFPFSTCNTCLECVSSTLGFTSHYSQTHRTVSLHWFDSESFGLALRCMVMGHGLLVWGVCVRCFALCSSGCGLRYWRFWTSPPTLFFASHCFALRCIDGIRRSLALENSR